MLTRDQNCGFIRLFGSQIRILVGFEYEGVSLLRVGNAAAVISVVCFFFSIYFAILSFQIIDMALRMQLMALATSFLVAGGGLCSSVGSSLLC